MNKPAILGILVLLVLAASALTAYTATTKIAPAHGKPGHKFTIVDTPQGRLESGSVAVFVNDDTLNQLFAPMTCTGSLRSGCRTSQGTVPEDILPGNYTVKVQTPNSGEFDVGPFTVIGKPPVTEQPTIDPTSGPVTTPFTITDPQGRMAGASVIVFSPQGQGPEQGTEVTDASFSANGKTATGTVPPTLASGLHLVTVHPTSKIEPPVFNALEFTVS